MFAVDIGRTVTVPSKFCGYCGRRLTKQLRTKDHVIARKFVPQGTLQNDFNLQIFCCKKCNGIKSRLEDDLSAITMQPDLNGQYPRDDERLIKTAKRKAEGSVSFMTKRKVSDSASNFKVGANMGNGFRIDFNFTGQPLVDEKRIRALAWFQLQGFYFFRSYNSEIGFGSYIPHEEFFIADYLGRNDWGNPKLESFANKTKQWEPLLHLVMADGYIRGLEKKSADGVRCWALEWNESYRCFGVWGDKEKCQEFLESLEKPKMDMMVGDTTNGWAYRIETPIAEENDTLFSPPENFDDLEVLENPHWK